MNLCSKYLLDSITYRITERGIPSQVRPHPVLAQSQEANQPINQIWILQVVDHKRNFTVPSPV